MTQDLRASFQLVDWAILALYFVFLLVVGFWKRKESAADYFIAGRALGLPVFVATLVATWYGGILGQGEFVYDNGIVAWTTNGLPYYVFAAVFAVFLARKVRLGAAHLYTIPDKLAAAYDKKTALLGAVFAFLYAAPATYVLMAGTLLHILFGWPLLWAMPAAIVFSVIYVFRGGFLSDVRINVLQFGLMFAGFGTVAWLCWAKLGGLALLEKPGRLPAHHLSLLGDYDLGYACVWFFIALVTLTDPGFHQRCYAAKTPRVAALGIGFAIGCWMVFDALSTTTGLFARALVPGLTDSVMAYPALAEKVLPAGVKGLFYVGMLAPIMASIVSYTFIAAMTIGRDFLWRLRGDTDDRHLPGYIRFGLGLTSLAAILISLAIPSVVKQWYAFGSVLVPGLLLPLLGAYAPPQFRPPANFAFLSMLLGATVTLFWLGWGWGHGGFDAPHFPWNWQPMYPGFLAAAAIYGGGLLLQSNKSVATAEVGTIFAQE